VSRAYSEKLAPEIRFPLLNPVWPVSLPDERFSPFQSGPQALGGTQCRWLNVNPAKAGVQEICMELWIPAPGLRIARTSFAGMTARANPGLDSTALGEEQGRAAPRTPPSIVYALMNGAD